MKYTFLFCFMFISRIAFCQQDSSQVNSIDFESKLNELLAETRKVKTLVEENGKFVKTYFSKDSIFYVNSFNDYVKAQSEFDEWIEFYTLEFSTSLKKKKYELNSTKLESIINKSIASANRYVEGVNEQKKAYALKGIPIAALINVSDYIKKAYDLYKEFRNSKKEHQQALVKELEANLVKYKIKSFMDL